MRTRISTSVCACLLALLAFSPAASASTRQPTIFQDDGRLLHRGDEVRTATLDELRDAGADIIKVQLYWSEIAPSGVRKPDGFKGWELSSYAEGAWARHDAVVRGARERGMRVVLSISTPAPGWATRKRGDSTGVWRPDPREYGRFVRAVATRYDGRHGVPRVDMWSLSNEPNHPSFMQPLGTRSGRLIAPHIYRAMVQQAVAGLRLAGHARDTVLFGELLPIGQRRTGPRNSIRPVAFLREFFCLDRRLRPFRGRAARSRGCHRRTRVSGVTGFAYHPYTRPAGPRAREQHSDDATIRSLGRITRVLDRAASARRLARRGMRIHITEFGYQSDPPDPFQTSLSRIPAFLNEAEWMAWRNRRVATWSQYGLYDDAVGGAGAARYGGFQSGLRFEDGRAKPGVYEAFRMPIFVRRTSRRGVEVWGAARHAGRGERVRIEQRSGSGGWAPLAEIVIGNPQSYFRERFRISRPERRRFRLVHGDATSRVARAVTR